MVSIIMPAHNEQSVIERGLRALVEGAADDELEVIVVCNGCNDQTADIARRVGHPVRVIETDTASKCHALNVGDEAARSFPRIYVDADVVLSLDSLRRLVAAMSETRALAAAPSAQTVFVPGTSWAVRAYYRMWMSLPYVEAGMVGAGTYALSREGRARFARFPSIIADDGFVRHSFAAHERIRVHDAYSLVAAPASLGQLVRIKTRSRLGYYQLKAVCPEMFARKGEPRSVGEALRTVARRPTLWPCVFPYLLVNLVSRRRARRQARSLENYVWERDESSRVTEAALAR